MHYLVMWSGGIDSTYTLARILRDTDHKITAHHIYLQNHERRALAENSAVRKLLPKLQMIREFYFTETMIDHSRLPGFPFDMAVVCFEAGVLAKAFEQNLIKHEKVSPIDVWTIGTHEAEGHWQTRFDVIEGSTRAAAWPYDAPRFELQPMVSKSEEIKTLDDMGLLADTWFCRTPKLGKPCRACKTCLEVSTALNGNLKALRI